MTWLAIRLNHQRTRLASRATATVVFAVMAALLLITVLEPPVPEAPSPSEIEHARQTMRLLQAGRSRFALERELVYVALEAEGPPSSALRERIARSREASDRALEAAVGHLRAVRDTGLRWPLRPTLGGYSDLARLRVRVDRELAQPRSERSESFPALWLAETGDMLHDLEQPFGVLRRWLERAHS